MIALIFQKKTFDKIKNKSKQFSCQICKTNTKCYQCECSLSAYKNQLYCIVCLRKFCAACHSVEKIDLNLFNNTDKAYLCDECCIDHFCNVCNNLCENACIYCDSCHSWLHYKCTKMTKSQIISYAKSSKKYYCPTCITQNIPFSSVSTKNLEALTISENLVKTDPILIREVSELDLPCNLCLECNPECSTCFNNTCIDQRRVCETCLICNYVLDKNELNKVNDDFESKFKNSLKVIHFNARSLQKHHKAICNLLTDSNLILLKFQKQHFVKRMTIQV